MNNKYRVLLILCGLFLFSPSCTSKSSTIFDHAVCKAPCWGGVTPSMTQKDDGFGSLSEVPQIARASLEIFNTNYGEGLIAWEFNILVPEKHGFAYFENDEIHLINLELERRIPISRFIEEFGDPSMIIANSCSAEANREHIIIFFTDTGLALTSFNPWNRRDHTFANIHPNLKIDEVFFFDPSFIFKPETFFRISDAPDLDGILDNLQVWHGYGMYNYIECE